MTRKLTLRTRPVLRSGANEWDRRRIRFNKTLWKADGARSRIAQRRTLTTFGVLSQE